MSSVAKVSGGSSPQTISRRPASEGAAAAARRHRRRAGGSREAGDADRQLRAALQRRISAAGERPPAPSVRTRRCGTTSGQRRRPLAASRPVKARPARVVSMGNTSRTRPAPSSGTAGTRSRQVDHDLGGTDGGATRVTSADRSSGPPARVQLQPAHGVARVHHPDLPRLPTVGAAANLPPPDPMRVMSGAHRLAERDPPAHRHLRPSDGTAARPSCQGGEGRRGRQPI
jgi:hypothetical protein